MKHLICALSGVLAGILSAILGGWTLALETLGIIMVLDYATGLIVAGVFHASPKSKGGALESKAAFKGLIRKVGIIVIVIAFHQLDRLTGKSFFRDGAAWAFFAEEFISVIENLGLMGLPMPKFVVKAVEWLRNKSDELAGTIEAEKPPDAGEGAEGSKGSRDGEPVPYGAKESASQSGQVLQGLASRRVLVPTEEEADDGADT